MIQGRKYYDALIVGAGFSGIHQLYHLRKIGLSAKILEAGDDLGGTWYWNTYPGARVDSELPIYQFSDPELWKDFTWSEKFPGWEELQTYFQYVDKKLEIKKDVFFKSRVVSAVWDDSIDNWTVTTEDGRVFHSQFLLLCTGIGPSIIFPTSRALKLSRAKSITLRGSLGLTTLREESRHHWNWCDGRSSHPNYRSAPKSNFFWLCPRLDPKPSLSATPEERELFYEDKWEKGGFHPWLGAYVDIFFDQKANDEVYAFWRKKTLERICHHPPELQEKLAPVKPPHPFGTKRPSLEQRYFEVYSQPNVELVDVNENPIKEITPYGILTADEVEHAFDVLILATGFDMVTGGITNIEIRLASATYPNMFWIYGPQSPSSFSNAPSSVELTSEWIIDFIKYMKEKHISSAVPTEPAQHAYSEMVDQLGAKGLWFKAKSWYLGFNIEGKKVQMLQFPGGIPAYEKLINASAGKNYEGFDLKRYDH
ncbi:hypothetical protein D9757_009172 [Collybiopsis confluens]|uniref:FAD/NAD(P)-binding domain-containing protein n=1 Tax=Collybiopsis confluens TaxID=2823264 RepID=A0A8H5M2F1_9AGAR|nr:hypothetical protein D9757_009172 [Collybiopsis confluens]